MKFLGQRGEIAGGGGEKEVINYQDDKLFRVVFVLFGDHFSRLVYCMASVFARVSEFWPHEVLI